MPRWNAANHPRYPNGKFRPKLSQSVRVSPISVSYNAGARLPIVPGRANLYVGALVRVERSGGNGLFQAQIDRGVNKAFGKIGDPGGRSNIAQLLKGNEIQAKGFKIRGPSNVINTPSFRVSSTPASRETFTTVRPPRRRVRGRLSAPASPGIATSKPKALPRGPKRVRKATAQGRRVRR